MGKGALEVARMIEVVGDHTVDFTGRDIRYILMWASREERQARPLPEGEEPLDWWDQDREYRRKDLTKAVERAERLLASGEADAACLEIYMTEGTGEDEENHGVYYFSAGKFVFHECDG